MGNECGCSAYKSIAFIKEKPMNAESPSENAAVADHCWEQRNNETKVLVSGDSKSEPSFGWEERKP